MSWPAQLSPDERAAISPGGVLPGRPSLRARRSGPVSRWQPHPPGRGSEVTRQAAAGIIASYDFSRFETLVDVGGGDGTLVVIALSTPAHLSVIEAIPR